MSGGCGGSTAVRVGAGRSGRSADQSAGGPGQGRRDQADGPGCLLQQLTKRILESALEDEITDHLGYEKHEKAGSGNTGNGTRSKTVVTEVPRDRECSFEPQIVKKRQRRLTGVDEMVLSLSAGGLTHGEISAHLAEVYGTEVSKQTKVVDGMNEWQNRPLDSGPGRAP